MDSFCAGGIANATKPTFKQACMLNFTCATSTAVRSVPSLLVVPLLVLWTLSKK